jgi:hypothetical protein
LFRLLHKASAADSNSLREPEVHDAAILRGVLLAFEVHFASLIRPASQSSAAKPRRAIAETFTTAARTCAAGSFFGLSRW